jgi:maleate isomerase
MAIGEQRVFERIREARPDVACTTPITAAFAAFDAFKAKRIGVLTPYRADVNQIVADYIAARGYEVPVFGSFNEGIRRRGGCHLAGVDTRRCKTAGR